MQGVISRWTVFAELDTSQIIVMIAGFAPRIIGVRVVI
jgi:hypothetical protein